MVLKEVVKKYRIHMPKGKKKKNQYSATNKYIKYNLLRGLISINIINLISFLKFDW